MSGEYIRDFDSWNKVKKNIDTVERAAFAHPREVWWCSLGLNIGVEADGKNENFERPILVVKVYNKHSMLVLPMTSKAKDDKFHALVEVEEVNKETGEEFTKTVFIKLTQARMISNKRLLRKVNVVDKETFSNVVEKFRQFI